MDEEFDLSVYEAEGGFHLINTHPLMVARNSQKRLLAVVH